MTYLKYVVLLMIVLLLVGCGKKDPLKPTVVIPDHIMPLRVGSVWVYDMYLYNAGNPAPVDSLIWIMRVTESIDISNETWYNVMHIIEQPGAPNNVDTVGEVYYTNRNDGLWLKWSATDSPELKLKYPATAGDVFQGYSNEFFIGGPWTFGVVSTGTSVTVPAGSYSCYHYAASPSQTLVVNDFYSPRVGWVRSDWVAYSSTYGWYTAIDAVLRVWAF